MGAIALLLLAGSQAAAQSGLGHLEDATVVPRGLFRLRAITVWSRFDSRFTATGEEPLGAPFTSSALGRSQIAALGTIDSLVSSAAAQPFSLSLGQSRLDARGRHEIVPIGVEYGLTRRLTVGVMVPVVRKRVAVQLRLDSTGANVGPNLHRTAAGAATTNTLVQTQFTDAATQLQNRLASCNANPAGAGCAALLARQSDALALIAASQSFASSVGSLYGTSTGNGQAFVPTAGSPAQTEIALRVAAFNAQYRDLLESGSDLITAVPVGAGGPAGLAQLQDYLTNELGGDSIATEERSGIGNVEVGVKALLIDRPRTETSAFAMRITANLLARIATSSQQSPSPIADLRLDDGRHGVDGRLALDLLAGRVGLLSVAGFAVSTSSEPVILNETAGARIQRSPDDHVLTVHVAPRVHLSSLFAIHAAYSMHSGNTSGAAQLIGGGVSYSTLPDFGAGRSLPMEMRYTHLESLSGPLGEPKYQRDQLELRIYFGRAR
ncbi:MAG TPA: hypothetical protein VFO66_14250 [Gemmatimonadaceae bacterium]|nr:hypothetical protein [Gemmatimonadaceae bacterium]